MSETKEEYDQQKDQEETGKLIDKQYAYAQYIKQDHVKKVLHRPENILYRLPLTEKQRAAVHAGIMRDLAKEAESKTEK